MKPIKTETVPTHLCPKCGWSVRVFDDDPFNTKCRWCGQPLDWSDELGDEEEDDD